MPATHAAERKLPAVSGSSGRLVVERTSEEGEEAEADWPGRVFEEEHLDYAEAMHEFVRRAQEATSEPENPADDVKTCSAEAQKRALRIG